VATTRETTHSDPVYVAHEVLHYAVGNIPGAVPHTSTYALTNVTLPYAVQLANKGWKQALADNAALQPGLNTHEGQITYEAVASAFDMPWITVEQAIK
jgi:alanine dehydrogenase